MIELLFSPDVAWIAVLIVNVIGWAVTAARHEVLKRMLIRFVVTAVALRFALAYYAELLAFGATMIGLIRGLANGA